MEKDKEASEKPQPNQRKTLAGAEKKATRLDEGYEGQPPSNFKPPLPEEEIKPEAASLPPQETPDA